MNKTILDIILEKHKAQPVGHGYIDIIVSRNNYKEFVTDIVEQGFKVVSISWWEWCSGNKENKYGLGGPESIFYPGWFAELPVEVDDLKWGGADVKIDKINSITNLIEKKNISFVNENVTFEMDNWLTPAFWLDVPKEWRNKYHT